MESIGCFDDQGEYSVYASRLSEVSVELDRSERELAPAAESSEVMANSISESLANLTTALSGSNETVLSYHIDEDLLTAITSSYDLRTANQMGLVTFVELNSSKDASSLRTAASAASVSCYSMGPSETDCQIPNVEVDGGVVKPVEAQLLGEQ